MTRFLDVRDLSEPVDAIARTLREHVRSEAVEHAYLILIVCEIDDA